MRAVARLSHSIAEGDGISILVEVRDSASTERAERQGADGLVTQQPGAVQVRASSELPLLYRGRPMDARGVAADAIIVRPDLVLWDESLSQGLECVVRVTRTEELEKALDVLDPEVVLLAVDEDSDDDPLEALLALLHDVPAGKLVIAELPDADVEDVAELERAGVDAVIVATTEVAALVPADPPEV